MCTLVAELEPYGRAYISLCSCCLTAHLCKAFALIGYGPR